MKRVLIITYYWPPTGGSGVQRWVKFSKYLPSQGWQPVVYSPLNPELREVDETLLMDIPSEVAVLKKRIIEPSGILAALGHKYGSNSEVNPINGNKKNLIKRISLWGRANLFIPDPRIGWVRPSVKYLESYLAEHPVDVIVTSGPPQSMHLIGLELHRKTGIPWVADFRDPWTKMFYYKHLPLTARADRKQHQQEKAVLDEANAIISVTPLVQREFQEMTSTRVELITNGFDEDDFPKTGAKEDGLFRITHTGLFAESGNPLVLWDKLAAKCAEDEAFDKALRIRLAGRVDKDIIAAIEERGLGAKLDNLGYLPHDETVKEQRSASVLILPLRQEPEYKAVLPGKIFEYLAARKPILGIGQEDGAAAQIINEACAGCMCDWDKKEAISEFIDEAWRKQLSGNTTIEGNGIDKFSRRSLTQDLVKLLESLCK